MCLGVPGKVLVLRENGEATVDVNGNQIDISIRLTPHVNPGEFVLIHAGFAMEIIDEAIAHETMQLLLELQELEQSRATEEQKLNEH